MTETKNYTVTLEILGKKYESKGETVLEALENLNLSWEQIKGKGVLTVSRGRDKHEHLFNMFRIRKIVANRIIRQHWAKTLEYFLENKIKSNI
jgi:hypothetical protein